MIPQDAEGVLRVFVNDSGTLEIKGEPYVDFTDFRRAQQQSDKWLESLVWVDAWAEAIDLAKELRLDDISLWWFVRNLMIERFVDLLTDIEAVGALVAQAGPRRLKLENANEYWSDVCQIVAEKNALPFESVDGTDQGSGSLAPRLAQACVSAARVLVGAWRARKLKDPVGVLTLGYTTWRRVNVQGVARHIDPSYELVLDRIRALELPSATVSAPAAGTINQQWTWLRHGNRSAVPIEFSLAVWWATAWRKEKGRTADQLRQIVARILSNSAGSKATWNGFDLSVLVRKFLDSQLFSRAQRAALLLAFFTAFFRRTRPRVLFLCHEYSGMAMAACAAARREQVPVVAVQHGVIWPAHYGYVLPRGALDSIPRVDKLCVFGEYERKLILEHGIYGDDALIVTGSPRLDLLSVNRPVTDRARLTEVLGLPPDVPLVLFTSVGGRGDVAARVLVDSLLAGNRPVAVIVKLHPSAELGAECYSTTAAAHGLQHVRVVREQFDLYDLFRSVDVHMSTNSTSLSEAVLFDKPNIMLGTDIFSDTVGYLDRDVAVALESYPSLSAAVADVLEGAVGERLARGRQAFTAHQYFKLDGQASVRVAAVLERLATRII